jgi:membrane protein implicated in regulation of membrane protease activity
MLPVPALWAAAGLFLMIAEFFVPGVFLMFFGFGALASALLAWIWPSLPYAWQWVFFAAVSVTMLLLLRKRMGKVFGGRTTVSKDDLNADFIGNTAVALTDLAPGQAGKVEINGVGWNAEAAEPIRAGTAVVIVSRDGLTFTVRKA